MKTKEFVKKVKQLGYDCSIEKYLLYVFEGNHSIACISLCRTSYFTIQKGDPELCKLCIEYAQTPLEEREEEKKYHLYLKKENREFYDAIGSYLTLSKRDNTFSIDVGVETAGLTSEFTQEKIDWIKERFNTDLEEFEQIEVDSDEV